ncbi:hypothetical protein B2G71_15980 [Novosphingobium sp. PC22D]|uniref:zinc-finger domain-containing protein n=1 Tax=Novosphingobium sp. PC22D TaxID=1962403 RepID=UPI000BEF86DF|nr:zinc-finger domain-containing protein [Novosphingobium sp. PC22D]PEQ11622.1 hypothetical protein B2G71_15980 [Novosphingobium sp. PC22D]
MSDTPETVYTDSRRVWCDGATDIRAGSALGHPRVYMEIDQRGWVECGYCDRRFVLKGAQERGEKEVFPGDLPEPGDASAA